MTTPPAPPPLEQAALDPTAVVDTAQAPEATVHMDPRWRVEDDPLQPSGVQLSVIGGQMRFALTQAVDAPTTMRVTTGHATLDGVPPASGPFTFADSSFQWNTSALPDTWGPSPAELRLQLRGDDGTTTDYTIDVVLNGDGLSISHTDAGTTTVDFTRPLVVTGRAGELDQFNWMRFESDATAGVFSVYASIDGFIWTLLFRQAMGLDMQAAFAATTITFSMTSSGFTGSGAWTVGAINVQPNVLQFAGLYLQSEDQAGFSYNRGVWSQFGPPLDGFREDQTFDPVTGEWYDGAGNVHYQWVSGLAYAPDDPNTVYAIAANRVFLFVSHDGGFHWTQRRMSFTDGTQPGSSRPDRTRFDMFDIGCPRRGELHVLAYSSLPADHPGIYHTTDEGVTWTLVTEFTSGADIGSIFQAGGMRDSSGKVWWSEQVVEVDRDVASDVYYTAPRARVLWSGALSWFIDIDDPPATQPYLEIPPLDDVQWTDAEGHTRGATVAIFTLASAGAWNPEVDTGVLWEDGLQTVWQNPDIEGIYGPIGVASRAKAQLWWQPPDVSDTDWALYWSLTDDMAERNRQINAANAGTGDPPPALPDLGGGPGRPALLRQLMRNRNDVPEPVNSTAGIIFHTDSPPTYDGNSIDYELTVSPHRPENCANVQQWWAPGPRGGGGKAHVVLFDDVFEPMVTGTDTHTERKAAYAMSGVLSVVILDVEPDDVDFAAERGGPGMLYATGMTDPAVGASHWVITDGEAGFSHEDSKIIGPPGAEEVVTYNKQEHATWVFTDTPNYSTPAPPLEVTTQPYSLPGDAMWSEGLRLGTFVVYGSSVPDTPDGWTLLEDSVASSSAHTNVTGGTIPVYLDETTLLPGYGMYARVETGEWAGIGREYAINPVTYNLSALTILSYTMPFDWTDPSAPISVDLQTLGDSYWLLTCAAQVYAIPVPESAPPPEVTVTDRRYEVKRCNFDGSALETVASIPIGTDAADPFATFYPARLQIRPFSDDLCLATSWAGGRVWRIEPGRGASQIWAPTLGAQPWDAIALDDNTFLAAANAAPDWLSGLRQTRTRSPEP